MAIFRCLWQTTLFSELQDHAALAIDATWADCYETAHIVVAMATLCTDLEMDESQTLLYFARRWSIQRVFRDVKSLLETRVVYH
jgi:hypothetical protein